MKVNASLRVFMAIQLSFYAKQLGVVSDLVLRAAKSPPKKFLSGLLNNPGDFLLSHTVTRAVPSAPAGLTSVFGMGTGVTLPTKSPENFSEISNFRSQIPFLVFNQDLRSEI